jgi:hypothetical protein
VVRACPTCSSSCSRPSRCRPITWPCSRSSTTPRCPPRREAAWSPSIAIDPKAVDPEDVETLEDLVGAAIVAATEEAKKLAQDKFGPLAQSLPGGIGGGQLPGM